MCLCRGLLGVTPRSSPCLEQGEGYSRESVCVQGQAILPPPPFPLLSDPLCHTANTRGPRSFPVQACPLPAVHAACGTAGRAVSTSTPALRGRAQEQGGRVPCAVRERGEPSSSNNWQRCRARQEAEMHCHCPRLGASQQELQGWQVSVHSAVLASVTRPVRAGVG